MSREGIRPDPKKVNSIEKWQTPENVDHVRSFLGLVGYYRNHIEDFATIAAPLQKLVKQNQEWEWKTEQEEAFQALKKVLTSEPILGHPRHRDGAWIVDVDASAAALGAGIHGL